MEGELRSVQLQRDRGRLEVSGEALTDALNTMRDDLSTGGVDATRRVLRSFVNHIEAQQERATRYYTFPLLQPRIRLRSVPPAGFDLKDLLVCTEVDLAA